MNGTRLLLKQSKGWFAAGREFQQAMALLSDGAFKLYVYVCLHAERQTGRLCVQQEALARTLEKDQKAIATQLAELRDRAVCYVDTDTITALEIRDRFWPYHKRTTEAKRERPEAEFVRNVRDLFLAPACVQATFTPADEKIAVHLHRRGITLQQVQRAILLGCARKHIAMINHQTRSPITSLQYFVAIVEEVVDTIIPESYWEPLRRKVEQMEQGWKTGMEST